MVRSNKVRDRQAQTAPPAEAETPGVEAFADTGPARYVGGDIPPARQTQLADAGTPHKTASDLAYDGEDKHVTELTTKVGDLVSRNFGGDYRRAFDHYDSDHDGGVSKNELVQLLHDAGVGNMLTRGKWANGILERVDKDGDGRVQWSEFESVFQGGGG